MRLEMLAQQQGRSLTMVTIGWLAGLTLLTGTVLAGASQEHPGSGAPQHSGADAQAAGASQVQGAPQFVAFNLTYHEFTGPIRLFDLSTSSLVPLPGLDVGPICDPSNPSLSGNARLIAFQALDSECRYHDIHLYDRESSSLVPLPGLNSNDDNVDDLDPAISTGGRFLAFSSRRTGNHNVFLYDRSTSSLVPLPGLNSPDSETSAAIAQAGNLIAFYSTRSGNGDVYLYDRTSSSLLPLPGLNTAEFSETSPSLSTDGRFLAFYSSRRGGGDIFLYDRSIAALVPTPGLNARGIGNRSYDADPSLSADGAFIALTSLRDDFETSCIEDGDCHDFDIFVYDRATSTSIKPPIPDSSDGPGEVNPSLR